MSRRLDSTCRSVDFSLQGSGRGRRIQSEKGDPDTVEDGEEKEAFVTAPPPTERGDFDKAGHGGEEEGGDEEVKVEKNGTGTVAIASPEDDDEEGLDDGPGITITVPSPQVLS